MNVIAYKISGQRYWECEINAGDVIDRGDLDLTGGSPRMVTIADVDPGVGLSSGTATIGAGYVCTWRRPIRIGASPERARLILVEGIHLRG